MLEENNADSITSGNDSYMNEVQLEYFRQKLLAWKKELEYELHLTKKYLQQEDLYEADLYDRASREINITRELANKDRYRTLIYKIDHALGSIEQGTYGYCIETGEPIGIERLEAQPVASLSVEAQERREGRKNFQQKATWQWAG
jgi:DnaK suppressor protein